MYHISDDPRAQASAKRICEALIDYAKSKPFSEISVSDLSRNYNISRTTFYRLFDNTVDVLDFACNQMGRNILLNVHGNTPKELTIHAISALSEYHELISLLCRSGHLDIFQKVQETYLPLSTLAAGMDLQCPYFHRLLAQMIPTSIEIWVHEGQKDSPEEVYEKLCRSIQMLGQWFSC